MEVDSNIIIAVTSLIGVVGGGIGFLIRRADKRRESNEELLIRHLEGLITALERENRWKDKIIAARTRDGDKWRGQLHLAGIEPMPAEWTEVLEDDK